MSNPKLVAILKRAAFLHKAAKSILGGDSAERDEVKDLAYRLWEVPNVKIASLVKKASEINAEDYEDEDEDEEACGLMASDDEDEDFFASDDEDDDMFAGDDSEEDCEDDEEDCEDDEDTEALDVYSMLDELENMDEDELCALLEEELEAGDDRCASDDEDEEDDEEEDSEDEEEEEDEDDSEEDEEEVDEEEVDEEEVDEEDEEDESSKEASEEEIFSRISSDDRDILSFMDHEDVDAFAEGEPDEELEQALASGCGSRNKKASQEDDLFFDEEQLEKDITSSISKKASQETAENQFHFDSSYEGQDFYGAESNSMIDDFLNGDLETKMEVRSAINKSASQKDYVAESPITMDGVDDPMAPIAVTERPRVKKASAGAKSLGTVFSGSSEQEEIKMLEKLWTKKPDITKLINGD
jgi:hypothetical protein